MSRCRRCVIEANGTLHQSIIQDARGKASSDQNLFFANSFSQFRVNDHSLPATKIAVPLRRLLMRCCAEKSLDLTVTCDSTRLVCRLPSGYLQPCAWTFSRLYDPSRWKHLITSSEKLLLLSVDPKTPDFGERTPQTNTNKPPTAAEKRNFLCFALAQSIRKAT